MNTENSDDGPRAHPGEEHDDVLIAEYVTGRAAPATVAALEARERSDAAFRAHVAAARRTWELALDAIEVDVTPEDTELAWLRVASDVGDGIRPAVSLRSRSHARPGRARRSWRATALAAAVVAAIAVGVTVGVERLIPGSGAPAQVAVRDIFARHGQRVAITLPDGGRILLAPGSRLQAPERFDGRERRVTLDGRAYFEVAHDPDRPFIVETDDVVVRVLGTEFDLRAWRGADGAEVVVRSGSVAVGSGESDSAVAVLERGERGVIDGAGDVTIDEGVNVDALLSWTTGRLVFERAALSDVIADLERWHDVTIVLADSSLASRRLTAAFDRESLDIILQTVAELVGARVQHDGRSIVLSPTTSQP